MTAKKQALITAARGYIARHERGEAVDEYALDWAKRVMAQCAKGKAA